MDFKDPQRIETDVLVIGGGAAGMRAAIEAKKTGLDVILVSESKVGFKNNSAISKAIFAATGIWTGTGDSPEGHVEDTVGSGRLINDKRLVTTMARGAKQQFHDLGEFGAKYLEQDGAPIVMAVPGHQYPRHILFAARKGTGFTIPMRDHVLGVGVHFKEGVLITKLFKQGDRVVGAMGIHKKGECIVFQAKATILATGGAGGIFLRTNNASGISGDGYALAYDVGATLGDMEFVQFYPTAECKTGRRMVMYEPLVRKGLFLWNALGEEILDKHGIKDKTKITRDVLARTIMIEILEGKDIDGCLLMGTEEDERKTEDTPTKTDQKRKNGSEGVKVAPTTHFFMGGVKINEKSETGIKGLYAAGEVCCGVHGANRLAGNAITETFVFGTIAGNQAASKAKQGESRNISETEVSNELKRLQELASFKDEGNLEELEINLRRIMWEKVGVIRNREGLDAALREIRAIRGQTRNVRTSGAKGLIRAVKMLNMLMVSEMICLAALTRTETRGAHCRTDYPEENNVQWLKSIEITQENGEMGLRTVPIEM